MIIRKIVCLFIILSVMPAQPVFCQDSGKPEKAATKEQERLVDDILRCVEKRYSGSGFSARFFQASILQAMKITDTANGRAFFKKPGMMRWEYTLPDRQQIITDGTTLWIYRPDDKQVKVGVFPSFFGDGKGAGFLADIRLLRRKFEITPAPETDPLLHTLRLKPVEGSMDVSEIYLHITKSEYIVKQVITYNVYGDKTAIDLIDSTFDAIPADHLFALSIPEGADVLTLDEP